MIPNYRVWAGFTIWIGMSILDALVIPAGTRASGGLSLLGFLITFAWAKADMKYKSSQP